MSAKFRDAEKKFGRDVAIRRAFRTLFAKKGLQTVVADPSEETVAAARYLREVDPSVLETNWRGNNNYGAGNFDYLGLINNYSTRSAGRPVSPREQQAEKSQSPASRMASEKPRRGSRPNFGKTAEASREFRTAEKDGAKENIDSAAARSVAASDFWDDTRSGSGRVSNRQIDAALAERRRSGRGGVAAANLQAADDAAPEMTPTSGQAWIGMPEGGPKATAYDRSGPGGGRPGSQWDAEQFLESYRKSEKQAAKQAADDKAMKLAEMAERGGAIRDRLEAERIERYKAFQRGEEPVGGYGEDGKWFAERNLREADERDAEALLRARFQRYDQLRQSARSDMDGRRRSAGVMPREDWEEYQNLKRERARIGTNIEDQMDWARRQVKADRAARNETFGQLSEPTPSPTANSPFTAASNFWQTPPTLGDAEDEDTTSSVRRLLASR